MADAQLNINANVTGADSVRALGDDLDQVTASTQKTTDALGLTRDQISQLFQASQADRGALLDSFTQLNSGIEQVKSTAEQAKGGFEDLHGAFENLMGQSIALTGGFLTVEAALGALKEMTIGAVQNFANFGNELENMRLKFGVPLELGAAWKETESVTGVSADRIVNTMAMMSQRLEQGSKQAVAGFEAIFKETNVTMSEFIAMPVADQMQLLSQAMNSGQLSAQQFAVAMKELGGRGALGLIPDLAADVQTLQERLAATLPTTEAEVAAAREWKIEVAFLAAEWEHVERAIGGAIARMAMGALHPEQTQGEGGFWGGLGRSAAQIFNPIGSLYDIYQAGQPTPGAGPLAQPIAPPGSGQGTQAENDKANAAAEKMLETYKKLDLKQQAADDKAAAEALREYSTAMKELEGFQNEVAKGQDTLNQAVDKGLTGYDAASAKIDDMAAKETQLAMQKLADSKATGEIAIAEEDLTTKRLNQIEATRQQEQANLADAEIKKQMSEDDKATLRAEAEAKKDVAAVNTILEQSENALASATKHVGQSMADEIAAVKADYNEKKQAAVDKAIQHDATPEEVQQIAKNWDEAKNAKISYIKESGALNEAKEIASIIIGLVDAFKAFGLDMGSSFGQVLNQVAAGAKQYESAMSVLSGPGMRTPDVTNPDGTITKGGLSTQGKIAGGLAALGAAGNIYAAGQTESTGAAMFGGALQGAEVGAMFGPIGAGVGAVGGALVGLLGSLNRPEYMKIAEDVGHNLGFTVTDSLAKAIAATETKDKVGRSFAELANLGAIMQEGMAAGKSADSFSGLLGNLIDVTGRGQIPMAEGVKQIGTAFQDLIAEGPAAGKAIHDAISEAVNMKVNVPDIAKYLTDQLSIAMTSDAALIKDIPILTKGDAEAQAAIFGNTFWSVLKNDGIIAAGDWGKTVIKTLEDELKKAHIAIPDSLKQIDAMIGLSQNPQFRAASDASTQGAKGLSALATTGFLNDQAFAGFGVMAQDIHDMSIKAGSSERVARELEAPLLDSILNASIETGKAITKQQQAEIDAARKAGADVHADIMHQQLDQLKQINAGVHGLRGIGNTGDTTTGPGGPGSIVSTGPGGPISFGPGSRFPDIHAASGFGPEQLITDTLIQAHAGETALIIPAGGYGGVSGGGGGPMPISAGSGGTDVVRIMGTLLGPIHTAQSQVAERLARVADKIAEIMAKPLAVHVDSRPNIILNEDPLRSRDAQENIRALTVEGMARELRLGNQELTTLIRRTVGL